MWHFIVFDEKIASAINLKIFQEYRLIIYLSQVASNVQSLIVSGNEALLQVNETTEVLLSAVNVFEHEWTVQTVLTATPHVLEWDFL